MASQDKADRPLPHAWERLLSNWLLALVLFATGSYAQVSFLPHKDFPLGPGCCLVAAGDFDRDGKIDLVVSYASNYVGGPNTKLAFLRGDGNGGFAPPVAIATFDQGIYRLLASDVNRDAKLDLLVSAGGYGTSPPEGTYLLFGRGDGSFSAPSPINLMDFDVVLVADFNGDGIPELLDLGACAIALGNGDGTFRPPLPSSCTPPEEDFKWNVAAADLTGDGNLDVAWASVRTSNGDVWLALGNGDGTLRPYHIALAAGSGLGGVPLAAADVNHDGKPDLVVSTRADGVVVSLAKGDGTFTQASVLHVYEGPGYKLDDPRAGVGVWGSGNDIFVIDFDGDGNPDIIVDNALLLGNGDGTFQPPLFFTVGVPGATLVFVGDLNGDGKPDLVFINGGGRLTGVAPTQKGAALSVLLNNSPGFPNSVLGVSAATGSSLLAPASIASAYGKNLAKTTASASGIPLPTQLGGISLRIRDNQDVLRLAPLYYVSPGQINFLVPPDTPTGPVALTIDDGSVPLVESTRATVVNTVSPGFFVTNGIPAASAVRVSSNGSLEPVPVFNCTSAGQCALTPIDLTKGPVYLSMFGTGFRFPDFLPACQVAGVDAQVQFAGAQPTITGLDQINILLPPSLPHGQVTVQCGFPGPGALIFYPSLPPGSSYFPANPVQIAIQ